MGTIMAVAFVNVFMAEMRKGIIDQSTTNPQVC